MELKERLQEIIINNSKIGQPHPISYDHDTVLSIALQSYQLDREWISVKDALPTEYGRYEVYRQKCSKQHYETWNNTGWAYNNNDITHWRPIIPPQAV